MEVPMLFTRLIYTFAFCLLLVGCANQEFGHCPGPNEVYTHGSSSVDSRARFEWLRKCTTEPAANHSR